MRKKEETILESGTVNIGDGVVWVQVIETKITADEAGPPVLSGQPTYKWELGLGLSNLDSEVTFRFPLGNQALVQFIGSLMTRVAARMHETRTEPHRFSPWSRNEVKRG